MEQAESVVYEAPIIAALVPIDAVVSSHDNCWMGARTHSRPFVAPSQAWRANYGGNCMLNTVHPVVTGARNHYLSSLG